MIVDEGRANILRCLREIERDFPRKNISVRDVLTGPIVDALFEGYTEDITKTLSSGVTISFKYTSKIARDFLMAEENPDYVWEPQTTKLLLELCRSAKQVLVGGAYFGDQAVLMAKVLEQNGGVCHTFEVSAQQVEVLQQNVEANNLKNVVVNSLALWDKSNSYITLEGEDALAAPHESLTPVPGAIKTISIDDYGREKNVSTLNLITLDIEGGEFAALRGAEQYLKLPPEEAPNLVFEIHRSYVNWDNGLQNTDIVKYVEDFGYTIYAIRDYHSNVNTDGKPVEIIPVRQVYLKGPPHGFNMLAIKDPTLVDRLSLKICWDVSPKLFFHKDPALHQPLH